MENAEYVRERLNVSGCEILLRVDYASCRPDKSVEASETRFFMTSLNPDKITPAELLQTIRDHWQVENCLHWRKDRYWDEDKHYLKWCGKIYTGLTNLAVSLLQMMRRKEDSLKATAEDVHYSPRRALRLFGFKRK